jgi:hypothetical protein
MPRTGSRRLPVVDSSYVADLVGSHRTGELVDPWNLRLAENALAALTPSVVVAGKGDNDACAAGRQQHRSAPSVQAALRGAAAASDGFALHHVDQDAEGRDAEAGQAHWQRVGEPVATDQDNNRCSDPADDAEQDHGPRVGQPGRKRHGSARVRRRRAHAPNGTRGSRHSAPAGRGARIRKESTA